MEEGKEILSKQIGAKVRSFRQNQGLSLEKLALECDMNAAFLGHVERGMRCPTIYTLQRICDGLHIDLAELFLDITTEDMPNQAAIHHVCTVMTSLSAEQAKQISNIVDAAVALLEK